MKYKTVEVYVLALAAGAAQLAGAAEWSDTSIGYRYGTKFAEPFNPEDISKNILKPHARQRLQVGQQFLQRRHADVGSETGSG